MEIFALLFVDRTVRMFEFEQAIDIDTVEV